MISEFIRDHLFLFIEKFCTVYKVIAVGMSSWVSVVT